MTFLESVSKKIRDDAPLPWYLDALLTAATPVYRAGMLLRGMRTPVKVDARVISFGNLTVGGTGKTPAVIERAEAEVATGNRVAVLTRGYGATKRLDEIVLTERADTREMADVLGDEPVTIARRVPQVVIARSADRVAAARQAIDRYGCTVLILDDGFQYLRLARDEDILVIDATNPFGNGRLLPRGILREPIASASRATHIVFTHCDRVGAVALRDLESTIRTVCSGVPIRRAQHAPLSLRSNANDETLDLGTLQNKHVVAVCAIANPESFVATLEKLGAIVSERRFFPDHADIPAEALQSDSMVIVTEKDAARMTSAPPNVYTLSICLADWTG